MRDKSSVTTHDEYLETLPEAERAALEKLRRTVRAAAPRAEECISYQLPAFRLNGKVLVLFGATAKHCSFFPGSGTTVEAHRGDLEGYSTSKGTIRFDADKPLPVTLVRRIVKYRIAENAAQQQRFAQQKSAKSTLKKTAKRSATRPRADKVNGETGISTSRPISTRITELGDWRGHVLRHVRKLIREADPGITEEWKWSNPVWSHNGIVCTGESYKKVVKLTFAKGASLKDPATLFNSSLGGNVRRAIDIHEGDELDESAFKDLVRAAVSLNLSGKKK